MPHLTVEYSPNLEQRHDVAAILGALSDTLARSGIFRAGGIRVRAYPAVHWTIADGDSRNAFVAIKLRIAPGRSSTDKQSLGQEVMNTARSLLAREFDESYFSLSLEITELDPVFRWNENTIHRRLAKATPEVR